MLSLWQKTSGTWINVFTILLGTTIGLSLRGRMAAGMQQILTQGLGLFTIFLGITMAGAMRNATVGIVDGTILGLLSIVFGGILGEALQIEFKLIQLGDWLKHRVKGGGRFTEGFVATSLLFCVGPMAILGCLNNGLNGDPGILTVKAVMDGLASIAFSSTYGIGVAFSSLMILMYQGSLSLVASSLTQVLPNPSSDPCVALISGVGGLMVMGIGCNLLELVPIRVSSFLPALLLAPILFTIAKAVHL
jgi:uncharacterized membrane protein YqgA involved in biofilm formation